MRKNLIFILFFFGVGHSFSQRSIDSLSNLLKKDKEDTNKVNHLNNLSRQYINISSYDNALNYSNQSIQLAQKVDFKKGLASACNTCGTAYNYKGDYPKSLEYYLKALKIDEEIKDKNGM